MNGCARCNAELDDGLAFVDPGYAAAELSLHCQCCGRRVWADCGGWPAMRGPAILNRFRLYVCDDCWSHALAQVREWSHRAFMAKKKGSL